MDQYKIKKHFYQVVLITVVFLLGNSSNVYAEETPLKPTSEQDKQTMGFGSYQLDPSVDRLREAQIDSSNENPENLTTREMGLVSVDLNSTGFWNPNKSKWYLKYENSGGDADNVFKFGPVGVGWTPITGDWDGNGVDTPGYWNPVKSKWYLKNSNSIGDADVVFAFGPVGVGWTPIIGDWDGNGSDTIGYWNPNKSKWYLKNSNSGGAADVVFVFGPVGVGWEPIVGDWDGNGSDTIGFYNPNKSKWYLKNSNSKGEADVVFVFGPVGVGWTPITGDWNGDGDDTIGFYNPNKSKWYLKNNNSGGSANLVFVFGPVGVGWTPITGDWGPVATCYTLTLNYVGTGSAPTANPTNSSGCPTNQYTYAQLIQVTPHPGSGWEWDHWTGTGTIGIENPSFLMPSSNKTVTAYYTLIPLGPTTLRIINDLQHAAGWDFYNGLIWIRTAAYCSNYNMAGNTPSGGTEYLWPLDFTYNILDREWLFPLYRSDSNYIDIDVSGIPLAPDGSYCVLLEAGWWDTEFDPYGGPTVYRKKPSNVKCCNGGTGCAKWATIQIIKPYGDPEVLYVHDWLPDYATWEGHRLCP